MSPKVERNCLLTSWKLYKLYSSLTISHWIRQNHFLCLIWFLKAWCATRKILQRNYYEAKLLLYHQEPLFVPSKIFLGFERSIVLTLLFHIVPMYKLDQIALTCRLWNFKTTKILMCWLFGHLEDIIEYLHDKNLKTYSEQEQVPKFKSLNHVDVPFLLHNGNNFACSILAFLKTFLRSV